MPTQREYRRTAAAYHGLKVVLPPEVPAVQLQRSKRMITAALVVLVAVGAALRLYDLQYQSIWLDEAASIFTAAHRLPLLVSFVSGSDAHPPLYYILLHFWLYFGDTTLWLRLLSALASIGSLALLFLIGRRLAAPGVALLATALLTVSAFQVWYAQETRMYAWTTLAGLAAVYALVRAWQDESFGAWVLFFVSMLAALYLDYSGFLLLTALTVWVLVAVRQTRALRRPFAVCLLLLFIAYLPWLTSLWHQLQLGGLTAWIATAGSAGVPQVLTNFFFNSSNLSEPLGTSAALAREVFSVAVVVLSLWLPRKHPAYALLAIWACWPFVVGIIAGALGRPILIDRTFMLTQPAIVLLLALSVVTVWRGRAAHVGGLVLPALLGLCLVVFAATNLQAEAKSWTVPVKEDWRAAASFVAANSQPGDLILFNAYYTQMPFDFYFQRYPAAAAVSESGYPVMESLLYGNLLPPTPIALTTAAFAKYDRVWLVVSHTSPSTAVPPGLTAHFTLLQSRHFVGIDLQLYRATPSS